MIRFLTVLVCSTVLLGMPASADADSDNTSPTICRNRLGVRVGSQRFEIPYCRSRGFDSGHDTATRAVIVIQSLSLNASDVYRWMWEAADMARAQSTTVVFAPQFPVFKDIAAHGLADDVPVWDDWTWACGGTSLVLSGARATQITSFDVVDQLIKGLYDRQKFPRLRHVVVVGQSAGGQFANRYAITNGIHEDAARHGLRMRYVVMNPSSYLYLDDERPLTERDFRVPDADFIRTISNRLPPGETAHDPTSDDCREYNDYPAGLEHRWSYAARRSVETIKRDYPTRDVRYLVGTEDIYRSEQEKFCMSCTCDVQGLTRVSRANLYWEHLKRVYSSDIGRHQQLVRVPGIGHSSEAMFKHAKGGLEHVFDYTPGTMVRGRVPLPLQQPPDSKRKRVKLPRSIPLPR